MSRCQTLSLHPMNIFNIAKTQVRQRKKQLVMRNTKYAAISQSHHFVPVAVETAGRWLTESLKFVQELGGKISAATGDQRETSHLLQRLSVALQIGNYLSVLAVSYTH